MNRISYHGRIHIDRDDQSPDEVRACFEREVENLREGLEKALSEGPAEPKNAEEPYVTAVANDLRARLLSIEEDVRELLCEIVGGSEAEAWDQALLSIRHIEDARMRLGKVIQHSGDGVSIYDKPGDASPCLDKDEAPELDKCQAPNCTENAGWKEPDGTHTCDKHHHGWKQGSGPGK